MTSHDHNKSLHTMSALVIEMTSKSWIIMTTGMLADYQLVHYDNNSLLVDLYQSLVYYNY